MAGEGELIGLVADALGISPQAQAYKRQNQLDYYNQGLQGLAQGLSLKESGIDPKVIEKTLGPDYAAHAQGLEKTDAFRQAAQNRATMDTIKNTVLGGLGAPSPHTIEGITPEEASGFFPRLSGPGISGTAGEVATAALTRPSSQDIQSRVGNLSPELKSILFGPAVASQGTAGKALEQVSIPGVGLEGRRTAVAEAGVPIEQGRLGLAQQQEARVAAENRAQLLQSKRKGRAGEIDSAMRILAVTHPGLTPAQAREGGKFLAGYGTGKGVQDIPGVVKSAAGDSANLRATYARLNTIADRIPNSVVPQAQKAKIRPAQEELDGANDAALREFTTAAAQHLATSGVTPNGAAIAQLVNDRMSFAKRQGSKIVAVPFSSLSPDEQTAKLRLVDQVLGAGGGSAGSARVNSYLEKATGQAAPAPAPAPAPVVQQPSGGGGSLVPGGGSVPGISYPVAVPNEAPGGLPAGLGGGSIGAVPGARRYERLIPRR